MKCSFFNIATKKVTKSEDMISFRYTFPAIYNEVSDQLSNFAGVYLCYWRQKVRNRQKRSHQRLREIQHADPILGVDSQSELQEMHRHGLHPQEPDLHRRRVLPRRPKTKIYRGLRAILEHLVLPR